MLPYSSSTHVVDLHLVPLGHRLADVADQLAGRPAPRQRRSTSCTTTSPGRPSRRYLEGGPAARPQPRVDGLDRRLDVLRVVVAAADDDHVLDPPRDEQLAASHEPEVAGPQERAFAGVGQPGVERLLRLLRPAPVPAATDCAAHPDLADRAHPAARCERSGSTMRTSWPSHGRPQPTSGSRRLAGAGRDRAALFQRGRVAGTDHRRLGLRPDRSRAASPRRVRSTGRTPPAEAARRERRREPVHRPRADRLGADGRDAPVAQVQGGALLGRDSAGRTSRRRSSARRWCRRGSGRSPASQRSGSCRSAIGDMSRDQAPW